MEETTGFTAILTIHGHRPLYLSGRSLVCWDGDSNGSGLIVQDAVGTWWSHYANRLNLWQRSRLSLSYVQTIVESL